MFTQCPSCQTLFRISPPQLRVAKGKVRCSHCSNIFNALDDLRAQPTDAPKSISQAKINSITAQSAKKLLIASEEKSSIMDNIFKPANRLPKVPEFDESVDSHSSEVRLMAELQDRAANAPELGNELLPLTDTQQEIIEDIYGLLEEEDIVDDEEGFLIQDEPPLRLTQKKIKKKKGIFLPFMGVLLLIMVAMTQLLWIDREQMMNHLQGNLSLRILCGLLACELPQHRAPKQIKITQQSVLRSPHVANQLVIKLTFSNQANFSQLFPLLQLSLFTDDGKVLSRKTFEVAEYLGVEPVGDNAFMQSGQLVYVQLQLEDKAESFSGYQFKFL